MAISVLEALNKKDSINIVDMTGHVVLNDGRTKKYYDLTAPNIEVSLDDSELLLSNTLFNDKDIESLILTNMATDILMKNSGNIFTREKADEAKVKEAEELFKEALALNPKISSQ